jgi:hypothetical protein
MNGKRLAAGLALAALILATPDTAGAADNWGDEFAESLNEKNLKLTFRYRVEDVEQDNLQRGANGSTLKTRLTFSPKHESGWGFLAEVDNVMGLGSSNYNDTRNGRTDRPVIADPTGTDLNQLAIRYSGIDNVTVTAGRQRILRTTQRFVGGVGWRQNEQTYDGLTVAYKNDGGFSAHYAYVGQVNRIFGPDSGSPPEEFDSEIHLLDASYAFSPMATVTAYGYFMDFDDAAALSNSTVGARLTGSASVSDGLTFAYAVEAAFQDDYADNPTPYEADFFNVEGSLKWSNFSLAIGMESLEGDTAPGQAFRTPLATLHKFQGWADKFLGTPAGGIEDLYVRFSGTALGARFALTWHDFDSESGSGSLGSEVDFSANWAFGGRYALLVKLANYDADLHSVDTTKFWLMLTAGF